MMSLFKRLVLAVCATAMIPVFVSTQGCGKDETLEDRKENYNQDMEDLMRSSSKRQEIEEELAEERADEEGTAEPSAGE